MDNRLLLVHSITLLFRESQLPGANENSSDLIRRVISSIRTSELNLGIGGERDVIENLKQTTLEMCETPAGHQFDRGQLLQRLRLNTFEEDRLYDELYHGITEPLNDGELKKRCLELKRVIRKHFKEEEIKTIFTKATQQFKFNRNTITDFGKWAVDVGSQIIELAEVSNDVKDPAIISAVNLSNKDQVVGIYTDINKQEEGGTLMRTGWQGVNRMLDGGFRPGESVVIGALQHKWKTGFSLSLFKQFAQYNTPIPRDITKKPCLLRISFEDPLTLNFEFLYYALKVEEPGYVRANDNPTPEYMAQYVMDRLSATGWHVEFLNVNPSMWTYKDIQNYVLKLESEGFEVHVCMLDYLIKIPTTGCDPGPMGHDICNMYERMTNWMKAKSIIFITPHQLNPEAKKLVREGRGDFVKEIIGKGYYRGSSQIDQVVDLEIYAHIEILNGVSYLTLQRGKHRKIKQTPFEHQYCVLAFNEDGIPDDIRGPDTTRKKVGGGPIGSKDETPFWEPFE